MTNGGLGALPIGNGSERVPGITRRGARNHADARAGR